ncbi:uncharacterized protein LTR77_002145 [Saxophila tyrrhenica]|uniref:Polyketide synthase n=1 Tax=Saxophila tyrrhenica TaxID=1690608 RepID=A0AAV9PI97_9PEZI|nr:hypothetical protein LTR77_002145 [Saxophila tyrrhenica]
MSQTRLLVYGDHLGDKVQPVKKLYQAARTRPLVHTFLQQAADALQRQLAALEARERCRIGAFSDLLELAEHYAGRKHNFEAVSFALTTAVQVGDFLIQAEDDTALLSNNGDVRHFGVCIGLLAATVGAASTNISDVLRLGVEIVAVAFRLGVASSRRSTSIEESDGPWATTFVGVGPDELRRCLDSVNENLPKLAHAYPGVVTNAWATVFAVPSTTEMLRSSPGTEHLQQIHVAEAGSAVHASDWPSLPLDTIMGSSKLLDTSVQDDLIFPTTAGEFFPSGPLRDSLGAVIADIGNSPLQLEDATRSLGTLMNGGSELKLHAIGPPTSLSSISTILRATEREFKVLDEPTKTSNLPPSDDTTSDLIAVVGMSGRFPGANGLQEFWSLLVSGLDMHEEIPPNRFDVKEFYDAAGEGRNAMRTRYGCFLKDPGLFDNLFFNVSPKEAMQMDPLQRMLLMSTYEALQQSGYSKASTSRVSSFFGQTTNDWNTINDQQGVGTHYIAGGNRAFAPGRLNHFFNWTGSHYSIDTACSASSTSVHLACNALLRRECDLSVVGGGSLCVVPEMFAGLDNGGFLSPTGGCKTFSDNADGYCRGEAVGVVILKRLDEALRDNDKVLSVIRSTARNSNGSNGSITYPSAVAQEDLFRQMLRQSQIDANEVNYVEMHGTGTQAGDTTEMASVLRVFAHQRAANNPLHVGAVKAAVGHSESAAGVVALIKTILMLRHDTIPPQPGPLTMNRHFPSLQSAKVAIADRATPFCAWDGGESVKRRLLINGFDAAGGNTSILMEDAPFQGPKAADPREHHVVAISGRTRTALLRNKALLREHLLRTRDVRLNDVAYTTTARRLHETHREAYVVDSVDTLAAKLASTDLKADRGRSKSKTTPLVFAFTGQSSLYTGMASTLYKTSPHFRNTLDSYQALCNVQGLATFMGLIDGWQPVASSTAAQQHLAIVALEIALARYWIGLGVEPQLVLGHSLGEYAALCVAGVLSVSSCLKLVHTRAELIEQSCTAKTHGMLATGLSLDDAQELLGPGRWTSEIACQNAPSMTVLSGELGELRALAATLKRKGVLAKLLDIDYGFHSRQLETLLDTFEKEAASVHYGTPTIKVASTLTGQIVEDAGIFNAAYLRRQTRERVNFTAAVSSCELEGYISNDSLVIEIGPHPVCVGLVPPNMLSASPSCHSSLEKGTDDWQCISTCLARAFCAGIDVQWTEFHKDYLASCQLVDLPNYAFDLTNYWVPYQPQPLSRTVAPELQGTAFISSSVQKLVSFDRQPGKSLATFASDIMEPGLREAIHGHSVNGVTICPASVFMDMAMTAAKVTFEKCGMTANHHALRLMNLRITQALVACDEGSSNDIVIKATLHETERKVTIEVLSETRPAATVHSTCAVALPGEPGPNQEWALMRRLLESRLSALQQSPSSHRMATPLFYRLFNDVVRYSRPYQSLCNAQIAESFDDATATILLGRSGPEKPGSFKYSPFILDALVHLAGFLLNSNLNKTDDDMYLANHIGDFQIFDQLPTESTERTVYASVREPHGSNDVFICDVFVFDPVSGEVSATCTDIRFQKMPRDVFSLLMGDEVVPEVASHPMVPQAVAQKTAATASLPQSHQPPSAPSESHSELLLRLLADELGLPPASLTPDCEFASVGLHSLASLKIIAQFKRQSGRDIPMAFLAEHSTADRVRKALGEDTDSEGEESIHSRTKLSTPSEAVSPQTPLTPISETPPKAAQMQLQKPAHSLKTPTPEANALLIHGDPSSTLTPLFLATAGIGLAAPYINIPQFPGQRALYALESPFVNCPEQHSLNVEHMAATWILAIRRARPKGPYLLGGYSAGGVYAYEIARQLAENHGERIAGLLIIDSRVPQPVPAALDIIAVPTNATGLSEEMKTHMIASARALVRYDPRPFPLTNSPVRTHLIWAKGGEGTGGYGRAAMGPIGEGRPSRELTFEEYEAELATWFCGERQDFGSNGWEKFVGGEDRVIVHTVEGSTSIRPSVLIEAHADESADHGTMMRMPQVKLVGAVVVQFIEQITSFEAAIVAEEDTVREV